ncbi:glycosyltransferase family 4 protein [Patescibacteria group bacterium]|nr:glycosyltransferase family 4 protein [Patescibacteria group bacterium]MBU4353320.1 glycosyltransferase family 4 protein [Patescibacteria group bacterium]MCG2698991.1 glycosyltransferase family 4 protein [Candidatus Parcubacteria bacterium]
MPKKILIFSIAYYPFVGGAEVTVKEITDRLVPLGGDGFQFDMITLHLDKKPARRRGGSPKFEKIGNINVYRIGGIKLLFPFFAFLKARELHKKNLYDLTWSMMAAYAGFAALFFKLFHPKIPYLLTLQEGDPIDYIKKKVRFVYPIFKKIFIKADHIQAISNYLADWAKQMGAKCQIEVVPNGVDIKQFSIFNFQFSKNDLKKKLNIKDDEKIIITTSRLVEKNGIGDLIGAIDILANRNKLPVKLLICGEGELEEKLKFQVINYKLQEKVLFLGQVSHNDLPRYLWISDVFCRPSLSEGLGNSFLEAMAAGVPVVATPVGGIPDFLKDGETGLFCEVNNPRSIAEKVKIYLENNELRGKIIANAQKMVSEKYDWNLIASKMRNIFHKL